MTPKKARRLEDKYLLVSKRDKIIHLLKDQKDMVLTIEILEFLKVNPHQLNIIKEIRPTSSDLEFLWLTGKTLKRI